MSVHDTAIVHRDTLIHESAEIGPYCIVGSDHGHLRIGPGSIIRSHSIVEGGSVITPARGAKVAPTSKQFSVLVAIVLGLIVGILLAILSTIFWPVRPVIETDGTATP